MEITPAEYEETLRFVHEASQTAPIQVKMTCAPHYKRIQLQERRRSAAKRPRRHSAHGFSRGCMAGVGFCFVSHIGEVGGCGYLPLLAGNVRQAPLTEIYRDVGPLQEHPGRQPVAGALWDLRIPASLCGGCRARALAATGNYLDEEPFCTYQPNPRTPRELVNVEGLLCPEPWPTKGAWRPVPNGTRSAAPAERKSAAGA